jgi:hypothetical protein
MIAEQDHYQNPTQAINRWKEAEETLKHFEEMMRMVGQFPLRGRSIQPKRVEYEQSPRHTGEWIR